MKGQIEKQNRLNKSSKLKSEKLGDKDIQELVPGDRKISKSVGISAAIIFALSFLFSSGGYRDEGTAEEVIKNRISRETVSGENLLQKEVNADITAKDFEVTGLDGIGEAKMLIWDFNKEDFDEVQVLVNGQLIKESVILAHRPAAISIPVPSVVSIRGVKDNGGGISYAVKFPNNKTTYFNVVDIGKLNTYKVLPK